MEHTQCRNANAALDDSSVWYGMGRGSVGWGGVVTGAVGVPEAVVRYSWPIVSTPHWIVRAVSMYME